ncbi:MAG: hypothetical protein Q9185_000678 [Variospora sp. 1 TL-2023]
MAGSLYSVLHNLIEADSPYRIATLPTAGCGGPRTSRYHAAPTRGTSRTENARFSSNTAVHDVVSKLFSQLREGMELSKEEIEIIFGKHLQRSQGNQTLHLVQEQRSNRTIDEDSPGSQTPKEQALVCFRMKSPCDKDQAFLARQQDEERAALGPQGKRTGNCVYAESVLEQTKLENLARRRVVKGQEEAKAPAEGKRLSMSLGQSLMQRRQVSEARVKWKDRAAQDDLHSVPQMSFIQRVGPATIMTAAVISLCVMFAQNYIPPSEAARLFPNTSPATGTISVLVAMNCAVWVGWRVLPLRRGMMKVFCLAPAYPYLFSMVGNLFSHQMFFHLCSNMVSLWIIGGNLHDDIGRGNFLALYLGCGIAASHIFLLNTVLFKRWADVTVGCSGALCALLATWCCVNVDKGIRIWPFPSRTTEWVQPLALLILFIAADLYGAVKCFRFGGLLFDARIDHVSHLAGYGAGMVAAQYLRPTKAQRQRRDRKQMPHIERAPSS